MHDRRVVERIDRVRHGPEHRQRQLDCELAVALQVHGEGRTLEQIHHVKVLPVGQRAEREDVDDVAVTNLARGARLFDEALHGDRIDRGTGVQHLDRRLPLQQRVLGFIDGPEATRADLAKNAVLAGQLPVQFGPSLSNLAFLQRLHGARVTTGVIPPEPRAL